MPAQQSVATGAIRRAPSTRHLSPITVRLLGEPTPGAIQPTRHPAPIFTDGASEQVLQAIDLLGVAAQQGQRSAVEILVAILTPLSQRLAGAQAARLPRGAVADREALEHDAWLGMRTAIDRWQRRGHLLAYVSVATKWHLARALLRSQPQSLPCELLAEIPDRDLDDYLDHLQIDRANHPTGD